MTWRHNGHSQPPCNPPWHTAGEFDPAATYLLRALVGSAVGWSLPSEFYGYTPEVQGGGMCRISLDCLPAA